MTIHSWIVPGAFLIPSFSATRFAECRPGVLSLICRDSNPWFFAAFGLFESFLHGPKEQRVGYVAQRSQRKLHWGHYFLSKKPFTA